MYNTKNHQIKKIFIQKKTCIYKTVESSFDGVKIVLWCGWLEMMAKSWENCPID